MADAFIYDHVRTPRGRGKADGALHEVTALNLASQALGLIDNVRRLDPLNPKLKALSGLHQQILVKYDKVPRKSA